MKDLNTTAERQHGLLAVDLENETLLAQLFGFAEGELETDSVISKMEITAADGKRDIEELRAQGIEIEEEDEGHD